MKLSVVIPARNEAGNVGATVDGIRARLAREGIEYEIVVVDDASTDATPDEVEARAAADPAVRLVVNEGSHGFGYAVRCGLDAFTGDAVAIMMADGSDSPDDLVDMTQARYRSSRWKSGDGMWRRTSMIGRHLRGT